MVNKPIEFNNADNYERFMGVWSRSAGELFLDWLAPKKSLRWIDVGCGSGAFTNSVLQRCLPVGIVGIDPSKDLIEFASKTQYRDLCKFQIGGATDLPFDDNSFDVACMALVLFFVPDPLAGVKEMCRVVVKGGLVAAYTWDVFGGGFPAHHIQEEMRLMGYSPTLPPSSEASRMAVMQGLWTKGGLEAIEVKQINVERQFSNFDEYWEITCLSPSLTASFAGMSSDAVEDVKRRLKEKVLPDEDGNITISAHANAIKGKVA